MSAAFDRAGLLQNEMVPQRIHFYVYNSKKRKVNFLVENEDGELELVNSFIAELGESNFFEKKIYINYGTDYHNTDASMARAMRSLLLNFPVPRNSRELNSRPAIISLFLFIFQYSGYFFYGIFCSKYCS